jgi:hypothetical protein
MVREHPQHHIPATLPSKSHDINLNPMKSPHDFPRSDPFFGFVGPKDTSFTLSIGAVAVLATAPAQAPATASCQLTPMADAHGAAAQKSLIFDGKMCDV